MTETTVGERVTKSLGDYVQVKDRIAKFYELFGGGRLVTDRVELWTEDGTPRIVVKALAYRTPDDPLPGVGWSWMELPGRTPYTKGSELENAETSAWGRAIGSLGILIDASIATQNEIDNKGETNRPPPNRPELERLAENLVGTVEAGKPPVDMQLRQSTDGPAWGFKLKAGRSGFQCLAIGPLADALALLPDITGQQVRVWGRIEMIPWFDKAGKAMPPFARIAMTRIQTDDWTLPAPVEAESAPLFGDDDLAGMPADWQA